jgi:hypothetical protein
MMIAMFQEEVKLEEEWLETTGLVLLVSFGTMGYLAVLNYWQVNHQFLKPELGDQSPERCVQSPLPGRNENSLDCRDRDRRGGREVLTCRYRVIASETSSYAVPIVYRRRRGDV